MNRDGKVFINSIGALLTHTNNMDSYNFTEKELKQIDIAIHLLSDVIKPYPQHIKETFIFDPIEKLKSETSEV